MKVLQVLVRPYKLKQGGECDSPEGMFSYLVPALYRILRNEDELSTGDRTARLSKCALVCV